MAYQKNIVGRAYLNRSVNVDKDDPYKEHFLVTDYLLDMRRDPRGMPERLVKRAIEELLENRNISALHSISVQIRPYFSFDMKDEPHGEDIIKAFIVGGRSHEVRNSNMWMLQTFFYGPGTRAWQFPHAEVPAMIDMDDPKFATEEGVVSELKKHIDGLIPQTCVSGGIGPWVP